MLRSSLFKTNSNNIASSSSSKFIFSATNTTAIRNIFVFTEQSDALANNAKHCNFKSNVWVEKDDEYWWKKLTDLKSPNEKPTEVTTYRLIEYFNLACLAEPSKLSGYDDFMKSYAESELLQNNNKKGGQHISWRTKLPFKGRLNEDLGNAAINHGYGDNKFWITATEVQKQKLRLIRGARRTGILINAPVVVYNADQFKNPEIIAKQPISGYKRRQYGGNFHAVLSEDIKAHNYSTGLYFTFAQLELFGLSASLREDTRPVEVPLTDLRGSNVLFNLDQVAGGDKLAAELNRYPVTEDTFMISGRPVSHEATHAAMRVARTQKKFKSGYWVSEKDIVSRGYALKEGIAQKDGVEFQFTPIKKPAVAIDHDDGLEGSSSSVASGQQPSTTETYQRAVLLYNVEQLKEPKLGFKLAGSKAML